MVVVLGTAGAIALGATLVGGGATIGALAASKSGNESRTIQKAINDISTKIKKEIETSQKNNVSTQNVTIQKTSVRVTGGIDIDLGCCQNVKCNVIKIKQTADSQTTANILADQASLNDIATNVANKLEAEQKSTTEQTTSALGSLLAAGNKSDTDSEVTNKSSTDIKTTIKNSLENTMNNLQSTDQSAPVVIEGGIHIGCSLGTRIGNKIFGTGDSSGKDVSGGLSLIDIEQGSVSAIAASIAAKQVVKNIVKDTAATDASSKQTAITTQKAGDMTMIAIICAICVMGALGFKFLKGSSKKGSLKKGIPNANPEDVAVPVLAGKGYRSIIRSFRKHKDLLVFILILIIVSMYKSKRS